MATRACSAVRSALVGPATVLLAFATVHGQEVDYPAGPRPSDWESPDAIVHALYDVISVEPAEEVDWDRDRALYVEGARQIALGRRADGSVAVNNMSVEDFIQYASPVLNDGFTEEEIGRTEDRYGNIMQVFSAYEGRTADGTVIARGINSIQLLYDGTRWWVASIIWDAETPDNPVPAEYLAPR